MLPWSDQAVEAKEDMVCAESAQSSPDGSRDNTVIEHGWVLGFLCGIMDAEGFTSDLKYNTGI